MIKTGLFDQNHLSTLKKAVQVYAKRHEVTAQNISNVETQGYKAKAYKFEEMLNGAGRSLQGRQTHDSHLPVGRSQLGRTQGETVEAEGFFDNGVNNVDIDKEMTTLATNDLSYRLATRLLSMRYTVLRGAIKGQVR
jgi:flagellar basal-body rod protein FlgB|nr:flagellar basal body rod protein FlgB [Candidatus Krumholzibacteria bacterium]